MCDAEKMLDKVLDWALANRGTENEFVSCYTYGANMIPSVLMEAKRLLNDPVKRKYKVVPVSR